MKKHRPVQITIDSRTFDTLWQTKEKFREFVGERVTWNSFLEQAALSLEAEFLLPSVRAISYNQYVYGAECPKCKYERYPLRKRWFKGKRKVVWKIKCQGCGEEFIALA